MFGGFAVQVKESNKLLVLVMIILPIGEPCDILEKRYWACGLGTIFHSAKVFCWNILGTALVLEAPLFEKVQVGKDQEKAQSERDSHSKNRGGRKPN